MAFGTVFVALFIVVITYVLYKVFTSFWEEVKPLVYKKDLKLTGKTVLITGANCGIGKATALDLAARGARVVLACRNQEKAEAAAAEIKTLTGNQDVSIIILDLSDLDSVKLAAENVIKTYDRLDVLINNAAIGLSDQKTTKQGFDLNFGTNHLGHFLFTQLLVDLLKKSAPSRIINVSSNALFAVWKELNYDPTSENGGEVKYPNLQGYPISKLANYFHVKTLVDELKGTRVTVNAVNPGIVKTEIMKRDVKDGKKAFLNKMFLLLSNLIGRDAKDGCQPLVRMAVDPEFEELTGEYCQNLTQITPQLSTLAKDGEEAQRLSKFSHDACQDYLPIRPLAAQDVSSFATNEKTVDDKKEDVKSEEKTEGTPLEGTPLEGTLLEGTLLQPTEAAIVICAVVDKKEDVAPVEKSEGTLLEGTLLEETPLEGTLLEGTLLQPTEAAIVTCAVDDKKEDVKSEEKTEGTPLEGTPLEGTPLEGTPLEGTLLEGTLLQPTDAAVVTCVAEETASICSSTSDKGLEIEGEQEETKEGSQLEPTEAAFVINEVEEMDTFGAESICAEVLDDIKEDEQAEKKEETLAAFVTNEVEEIPRNEVEEIPTIGAASIAGVLDDIKEEWWRGGGEISEPAVRLETGQLFPREDTYR